MSDLPTGSYTTKIYEKRNTTKATEERAKKFILILKNKDELKVTSKEEDIIPLPIESWEKIVKYMKEVMKYALGYIIFSSSRTIEEFESRELVRRVLGKKIMVRDVFFNPHVRPANHLPKIEFEPDEFSKFENYFSKRKNHKPHIFSDEEMKEEYERKEKEKKELKEMNNANRNNINNKSLKGKTVINRIAENDNNNEKNVYKKTVVNGTDGKKIVKESVTTTTKLKSKGRKILSQKKETVDKSNKGDFDDEDVENRISRKPINENEEEDENDKSGVYIKEERYTITKRGKRVIKEVIRERKVNGLQTSETVEETIEEEEEEPEKTTSTKKTTKKRFKDAAGKVVDDVKSKRSKVTEKKAEIEDEDEEEEVEDKATKGVEKTTKKRFKDAAGKVVENVKSKRISKKKPSDEEEVISKKTVKVTKKVVEEEEGPNDKDVSKKKVKVTKEVSEEEEEKPEEDTTSSKTTTKKRFKDAAGKIVKEVKEKRISKKKEVTEENVDEDDEENIPQKIAERETKKIIKKVTEGEEEESEDKTPNYDEKEHEEETTSTKTTTKKKI